MKEFLFHSTCKVRNGNFLKMHASEIRVKQIHVNQGLGVEILKNQVQIDKGLIMFTDTKL